MVAAVMDADACPAEAFLVSGEAAYRGSRDGLTDLLERVATHGLDVLSTKLVHEADKRRKVYEFIKGDLRLFFFKGAGDVIVVCTAGRIKKGQKVDRGAVEQAARWREEYQSAVASGAVIWAEEA
jgi:hypothetical protein